MEYNVYAHNIWKISDEIYKVSMQSGSIVNAETRNIQILVVCFHMPVEHHLAKLWYIECRISLRMGPMYTVALSVVLFGLDFQNKL